MGYTTDFDGSLTITPKIKPEHAQYINKFSETRRMKRNADETAKRSDPTRIAAGLPNVGTEGCYFVGAEGMCGQERSADVVEYNYPPEGQPGLWCQWIVVPKDTYGHENPEPFEAVLEWDGGEKFYDYEEWLSYLIEHFFEPWGYKLNGQIKWQGEDMNDRGIITVEDNVVKSEELV